MADDPVLTERRDGVLLITLNRPDARNAVNLAVAEGIASALDTLDGDDDLTVGVLAGAGKGFSAGMDLKAFVTGERPWVGDRGFAGIVRRSARKPLIAAVEGFAMAGGLEIALACDLLVAARDARLAIPEVKRSLVAAGGALRRLPQRLPLGVALEMALTGDPISAQRGYELGLVNRLTDPGGAVDAALELAAGRRAGAGPPPAGPGGRGRRGAGARGGDREERAARPRRDEADRLRAARRGRPPLLGRAVADLRPGVRLRRCARGGDRVQREARACVAGALSSRSATRTNCSANRPRPTPAAGPSRRSSTGRCGGHGARPRAEARS